MSAILIVRAQVADAATATEFDQWYQAEHLPEAVAAFKAIRAWRGWSDMEAGVHFAFYEFPTLERARAVSTSSEINALIAEFDRRWGDRVTRTREVIEARQQLVGPGE